MTSLFQTDMDRGADFSPCRTWRYSLLRTWSAETAPPVVFIGLNPSTADERLDDPTIRRCINFARAWGYGGLVMLNLFGFRATKPADMLRAADPVGPGNLEAFRAYRHECDYVAAWGTLPAKAKRLLKWDGHVAVVREAIGGGALLCLGKTKSGDPRHPLYVRGDTKPREWTN